MQTYRTYYYMVVVLFFMASMVMDPFPSYMGIGCLLYIVNMSIVGRVVGIHHCVLCKPRVSRYTNKFSKKETRL